MRSSGLGMPTSVSESRARRYATRRETSSCARIASTICHPTLYRGWSDDIGSWNIIAIRLPRMARSSSASSLRRSRPSKSTLPSIRELGKRVRPRIVSAETLFPEPDSPTIPIARPRSTEYEAPLTALTIPSPVRKRTCRPRTSSRATSVPDPRVDERVQDVDDQVRADDEHGPEQHGSLDGRQVRVDDRVVGVAPDPRIFEHGLREHGAAEEKADVESRHGDDGRERGAQAVPADDAAFGEPLGARGPDVVLAHHLDEIRPHHPCVKGGERGGEHEPRHEEGEEPLLWVLGQRDVASRPGQQMDAADVAGEEEEADETEEVDRWGNGHRQAAEDLRPDRDVVLVRVAEVEVKDEPLHVDPVLLVQGLVEAERMADLLDQGRGRLPAGPQGRGVGGGERVEDQEGDPADDDQQEDSPQDAARDVARHRGGEDAPEREPAPRPATPGGGRSPFGELCHGPTSRTSSRCPGLLRCRPSRPARRARR